jgi:FkbM family methyltransferase
MPDRPPPRLPETGFNELAACRTGPMLFNRHDMYVGASLRKYGEFSRGESELFAKLIGAGAVVIEVGANIGAHTVELSRLVGPQGAVLAFEPQRLVFQTLCANLALNSCANVFAFQSAIGAAPGSIAVPLLDPNSTNNFGGLSLLGTQGGAPDGHGGERVPLRTIDEFGLKSCHLIKLDLEGMEVEALRGAAGTIAATRPLLYVENDRRERAAELIGLLLSWNYRLYSHTPPLFLPDNYAGDGENLFSNIVSINLLCIGAERNVTVQGLAEVTAP